MQNKVKYYQLSGGPVHQGDYIYIKRPEDESIFKEISDNYNFAYLHGPRQIGKSSLAVSIQNNLKQNGWHISYIDFRGTPNSKSKAEDWFLELMQAIGGELDIKFQDITVWYQQYQKKGLSDLWKNFFTSCIRNQIKTKPILFIFDEIDSLHTSGTHTDDFFQGLQILYDHRLDAKMSVLLIGVSHPQHILKTLKPSDIKGGRSFPLPDFCSNDKTIHEWCSGLLVKNSLKMAIGRLMKNSPKKAIGREIFSHTGGHPYLNALIFGLFNEQKKQSVKDVKAIVDELIVDAKNINAMNPHFNTPVDFITHNERYAYEAIDAYKKILQKPIPISSIKKHIAILLKTSGLVRDLPDNYLDIRCSIYRKTFDEKWCKDVESQLGRSESFRGKTKQAAKASILPSICLINVGGTIGMKEVKGKMRTLDTKEEFLSLYPGIQDIAHIDLFHINPTDSANIFPEHWVKIAEAIYNRIDLEYNGFVIAHGTDTMVYTASAVSFSLGPGLHKPVVFVGSQAPHHVMHGDALINLYRAIKVATQPIPEVVICFGDLVFRAVRTEKKDDYRFSGFHSPSFEPLAIIAENIELSDKVLNEKKTINLISEFETNILKIAQYPGLKPELFYPYIENKKIAGLIIETLGVGNLPTAGELYNFLPLIEKAKNQNIPVVVTSRYPIRPEFMKKYQPASEPLQKGAISAGNMTSAAALTKFMWILPQLGKLNTMEKQDNKPTIKEMMTNNYVGEIDFFKIPG